MVPLPRSPRKAPFCHAPALDRDRVSIKGASHEVVKKVLVAVLIAAFLEMVLSHDVVIGVVSPPSELLALFGNARFLFPLHKVSFAAEEMMVL